MKRKFVGLIIMLLIFSPLVAHGAGIRGLDLQLGLGSVHAEKRSDGKPWNEKNSGAAIQYVSPGVLFGDNVEYCATAGQISNSEYGQSLFMGGCFRKTVLRGSLGKVSIGAFAGVMTYPSIYNTGRGTGDLFPAILPTASACLKNETCMDTTFIPKIQEKTASAAILFVVRFPIRHW